METSTMRITSLQNSHIKNVVKLRRRKHRDQQQKVILEGYRLIRRALDNHFALSELYFCPKLFLGSNELTLIQQAQQSGTRLWEVGEEPFRKMAERQRPEGLLAIAPQVHRRLENHHPTQNGFYLIVESIERPGNLGSILRSADGAGVHGMIVCEPLTDLYHPEVIQASAGAFFSVLILESSSREALRWCRTNQVHTLAATPDASQLYTTIDMRGAVALIVGTEQVGLSQIWMDGADEQIKLPMYGQADSLNVAMAATLLLYEVIRQRS